MAACTETKKTTDLLYLLTTRKGTELNLFLDKILDLKKTWMQNPNALNELRYHLALERYGRLQKDTVDLAHLEQKIEYINFDSQQ